MKTPTEIIAERIGAHEAAAVVTLLKETGWLIFRHDAIRQAQADERRWCSDNTNEGAQRMEINK